MVDTGAPGLTRDSVITRPGLPPSTAAAGGGAGGLAHGGERRDGKIFLFQQVNIFKNVCLPKTRGERWTTLW